MNSSILILLPVILLIIVVAGALLVGVIAALAVVLRRLALLDSVLLVGVIAALAVVIGRLALTDMSNIPLRAAVDAVLLLGVHAACAVVIARRARTESTRDQSLTDLVAEPGALTVEAAPGSLNPLQPAEITQSAPVEETVEETVEDAEEDAQERFRSIRERERVVWSAVREGISHLPREEKMQVMERIASLAARHGVRVSCVIASALALADRLARERKVDEYVKN